MARLPPNISKNTFRPGEYVAHCQGAQRVIKTSGGWCTAGLLSLQGVAHYRSGRTLAALGAKLEPLNVAQLVADEPAQDTCAEHRQPIDRCPARCR